MWWEGRNPESAQRIPSQDAEGNWILNDPQPNKQQELAKCQRYFWSTRTGRHNFTTPTHSMVARSESRVLGVIALPVPMRLNPVIKIKNAIVVRDAECKNICYPSSDNASFLGTLTSNAFLLDITMANGSNPFTTGEVYNILIGDLMGTGDSLAGSALELSADL